MLCGKHFQTPCSNSLIIRRLRTAALRDLSSFRSVGPASHLPDHAVPRPSHQLAVFPVGDQVEVVGELDGAGQLLQDVYAEALAAQFGVGLGVADDTGRKMRDRAASDSKYSFVFNIL